jgi:hypothetical protein
VEEGGGWRVEGGGWRVEGTVEGGEKKGAEEGEGKEETNGGGGWRVESGEGRSKEEEGNEVANNLGRMQGLIPTTSRRTVILHWYFFVSVGELKYLQRSQFAGNLRDTTENFISKKIPGKNISRNLPL